MTKPDTLDSAALQALYLLAGGHIHRLPTPRRPKPAMAPRYVRGNARSAATRFRIGG